MGRGYSEEIRGCMERGGFGQKGVIFPVKMGKVPGRCHWEGVFGEFLKARCGNLKNRGGG